MDREQATLKIKTSDFVRDKEWIDPKRLGQAATEIADFALGQYEAGQRAERERIATEIDRRLEIDVQNADWRQIANYPDELRNGPHKCNGVSGGERHGASNKCTIWQKLKCKIGWHQWFPFPTRTSPCPLLPQKRMTVYFRKCHGCDKLQRRFQRTWLDATRELYDSMESYGL